MYSGISQFESGGTIDPLAARWERILIKEGMPSELPYNTALPPTLSDQYEQVASELREELDAEPTNNEVVEAMSPSRSEEVVLREYGKRVLWLDEAEEQAPEGIDSVTGLEELHDPEEPPQDVVAAQALPGLMRQQLETVLSEREADILARCFGLNSESPQTYDLIGAVHGISVGRVGQIVTKALSKMRLPGRNQQLSEWLEDDEAHNGDVHWPPRYRDLETRTAFLATRHENETVDASGQSEEVVTRWKSHEAMLAGIASTAANLFQRIEWAGDGGRGLPRKSASPGGGIRIETAKYKLSIDPILTGPWTPGDPFRATLAQTDWRRSAASAFGPESFGISVKLDEEGNVFLGGYGSGHEMNHEEIQAGVDVILRGLRGTVSQTEAHVASR
jgi:hypothetical protein